MLNDFIPVFERLENRSDCVSSKEQWASAYSQLSDLHIFSWQNKKQKTKERYLRSSLAELGPAALNGFNSISSVIDKGSVDLCIFTYL